MYVHAYVSIYTHVWKKYRYFIYFLSACCSFSLCNGLNGLSI